MQEQEIYMMNTKSENFTEKKKSISQEKIKIKTNKDLGEDRRIFAPPMLEKQTGTSSRFRVKDSKMASLDLELLALEAKNPLLYCEYDRHKEEHSINKYINYMNFKYTRAKNKSATIDKYGFTEINTKNSEVASKIYRSKFLYPVLDAVWQFEILDIIKSTKTKPFNDYYVGDFFEVRMILECTTSAKDTYLGQFQTFLVRNLYTGEKTEVTLQQLKNALSHFVLRDVEKAPKDYLKIRDKDGEVVTTDEE